MQGQQHLPLAAHLPSLPLAPHAAAAAAAAAAGINAGGAAGLMSMAGRLPSSSGHMHSGRSSSGVKEEKGLFLLHHSEHQLIDKNRFVVVVQAAIIYHAF